VIERSHILLSKPVFALKFILKLKVEAEIKASEYRQTCFSVKTLLPSQQGLNSPASPTISKVATLIFVSSLFVDWGNTTHKWFDDWWSSSAYSCELYSRRNGAEVLILKAIAGNFMIATQEMGVEENKKAFYRPQIGDECN